MRSKLMLAVPMSLALMLAGHVNAGINIEQKAEIMADMINALTPKTEKNVTVLGASSEGNKIIISSLITSQNFKAISDEEFEKIKPVLSKAFHYSVCGEETQKEFVSEGGAIVYDLKETTSGKELRVVVDSCAR